MTSIGRRFLCLLGCLGLLVGPLPLGGQERAVAPIESPRRESPRPVGLTEASSSLKGGSMFRYDFRSNFRAEWLGVSPQERVLLAKRIGDQGTAWWARQRGLKRLCGATGRDIPQGLDGIYLGTNRARVVAVESKGGSSEPSFNYGARQGTNLYAVRAARRVLLSSRANLAEKVAHARLLAAARAGRLESVVVRTEHVRGRPGWPMVESIDKAGVRLEAWRAMNELERSPVAVSALRLGRAKFRADLATVPPSAGLQGLGATAAFGGAALMGWQAYQESLEARDAFGEVGSGDMTLGMATARTGLAAMRWASAGMLGLAPAQLVQGLPSGLRAAGRVAGKYFLPVAAGVELFDAGIALHEYSEGMMTWGEFCRRAAGPTVFAGSVTVGAGVGALVGALAGGAGAAPGAYLGGNVGALAAIPLQYAVDWYWSDYFEELDSRGYAAMATALAKHYGAGQ